MNQRAPISPEDLREFFYRCGLTLAAAQRLEYGLKFLLWLLADRGLIDVTRDEATAIIEDTAKKTTGQVLRLLDRHVTLDADERNCVEEALAARNCFVHHFVIDSGEALVDPRAREAKVTEVKEMRRLLLKADEIFRAKIAPLFDAYGLNWEAFNERLFDEISAKSR